MRKIKIDLSSDEPIEFDFIGATYDEVWDLKDALVKVLGNRVIVASDDTDHLESFMAYRTKLYRELVRYHTEKYERSQSSERG